MKRIGYLSLVALTASVAFAQTTAILQLGSQSTAGTAFSLNLTLSGAAAPAGLQWTLRFIPGTVGTLTQTASAASKSLMCNTTLTQGSSVCVLSGLNTTSMSDGVVAVISGTIPPGQNNHVGFNLTDAVGVDGSGNSIPAIAVGGSVDQPTSGITVPLSYLKANQLGRGLTLQNGQLSVIPGGNQGARGPAGAPAVPINFVDDDNSAVINTDGTMILSQAPNPASSLHVARNGLMLKSGIDFTVSGQIVTILYLPPVPASGELFVISYRF